MLLALTCAVCLTGAESLAGPVVGYADGELSLSLASAPAASPGLGLTDFPPATEPRTGRLAQHQHGSEDGQEGEGSEHHGGHGAWMGATMIVVMAVMMVGLGVVMMSRGSFRAAPGASAAAMALPVAAPGPVSPPVGGAW